MLKSSVLESIAEETILSMLDKQHQRLLSFTKKGDKQYNEVVLMYGGVTHYFYNGVWYNISVYTPQDLKSSEYLTDADNDVVLDLPPKYKYHVRNAHGNYVFFKTKERDDAQKISDSMFGKGKYTVSSSKI